jgi:3-oxoacyl-[acyl-carrier protein] reductase
LVSGAGRGIGAAIAQAFAAAGAHVYCLARSSTEVSAQVAAIVAKGGQADAIACDVTDTVALAAVLASIEQLDILVINAGTNGERAPITDSDPAIWRQVIELNIVAAYEQARLAIPALKKNGGGKIITMGSGIGRRPAPGGSAYAVSKAGLAMLTRALASELRRDHIAVNEIVPGPVRTAMTGVPTEDSADEQEMAAMRQRFPASEWLKNPGDVAPLALYLASLPNDGPTGQTFSLMGRDM